MNVVWEGADAENTSTQYQPEGDDYSPFKVGATVAGAGGGYGPIGEEAASPAGGKLLRKVGQSLHQKKRQLTSLASNIWPLASSAAPYEDFVPMPSPEGSPAKRLRAEATKKLPAPSPLRPLRPLAPAAEAASTVAIESSSGLLTGVAEIVREAREGAKEAAAIDWSSEVRQELSGAKQARAQPINPARPHPPDRIHAYR